MAHQQALPPAVRAVRAVRAGRPAVEREALGQVPFSALEAAAVALALVAAGGRCMYRMMRERITSLQRTRGQKGHVLQRSSGADLPRCTHAPRHGSQINLTLPDSSRAGAALPTFPCVSVQFRGNFFATLKIAAPS